MFLFPVLSHSKYHRRAAYLASLVLLAASLPVFADEITIDDSPEPEETVITLPEETSDTSGDAFIEDLGMDYDELDGISIDDLEEETPEELTEEIDLIDADPQRIAAHLEKLLETDSPTGSEGELTAASYIESEMKALGYTVSRQPFHEGFVNVNGIDAPGVNVIAERGANAEENRTRDIFLIVTHYDSKTFPKQTSSASGEIEAPSEEVPYANDKSGAAVLLETARILSGEETDTDLCFLFLSGQEDGGYGAKAFLESLSEENRSRIKGVLAVDRVGYDTGMPNVLKTLTGESNKIVSQVQECGIWQEAGLILDGIKMLPENLADDQEETEDSLTDSNAAGETQLPSDGVIIQLEDAGSLSGGDQEIGIPAVWSCLIDPYAEPENEDQILVPGRNSIQSIFASAQFPAAGITQYDPAADRDLYRKTIRLGLADTTADDLYLALQEIQNDGIYEGIETFNDLEIVGLDFSALESAASDTVPDNSDETETETEAEPVLPRTDPLLLAQTADVVAETLLEIMM